MRAAFRVLAMLALVGVGVGMGRAWPAPRPPTPQDPAAATHEARIAALMQRYRDGRWQQPRIGDLALPTPDENEAWVRVQDAAILAWYGRPVTAPEINAVMIKWFDVTGRGPWPPDLTAAELAIVRRYLGVPPAERAP